jgi:hypothetical protein
MLKIIGDLIISFLLLGVFTILAAQNVEFQLGGKTNAESFEIKDSDGNVLFQLKGNGKIGLGSAVLKNSKMHVQGSINSQGVYKIQGKRVLSIKGTSNTFVGENAGYNNTGGNFNTFISNASGYNNTTGNYNTFVGEGTGSYNTIGSHNTFMGTRAGYGNTGGIRNNYVGYQAGYANTTGNFNNFIGFGAGLNNTSSNNNFMGDLAGENNSTGSQNTFIGDLTGWTNTTGEHNTYIGAEAGYSATGSGNIFLGWKAGFTQTGSNLLHIDNSSTNSPLIWGDFSADSLRFHGDVHVTGDLWVDGSFPAVSDIRFKKNLSSIDNALDGISSLNGVSYIWNKEKFPERNFSKREQIGVIAQEVEAVYPQLVYTDKEGYKRVDYSKLTAVLIEAVKEQQNLIESQNQKIDELTAENNLIKDRLESIESLIQLTYHE